MRWSSRVYIHLLTYAAIDIHSFIIDGSVERVMQVDMKLATRPDNP